jgi:hypothetical protein
MPLSRKQVREQFKKGQIIHSSTRQGLAFSEKIRIMPARVNVARPGEVEKRDSAQAHT